MSWTISDVQNKYCPFCHEVFEQNILSLHADTLTEKLQFYWKQFFSPKSLIYSTEEDCPNCDILIDKEDADPYTPGVQTKLAVKLKKIKDPKERAAIWLKSVKK